MSEAHMELLRDLVAGRSTPEDIKPRLGKYCTLEHKCEQDWKRPGSDEKEHRDGHRIAGCKNPNQDTDWLWTDWSDGTC